MINPVYSVTSVETSGGKIFLCLQIGAFLPTSTTIVSLHIDFPESL